MLFFIFFVNCVEILDLRNLFGKVDTVDHLKFAAVIDAGSTGTRLNIFGFNSDMMLEFYYLDMVEPGLSALILKDVARYINKLLDNAQTRLDEYKINIHEIPLSFQATAGLRMLPTEESRPIVKTVDKVLQKYNIHDIEIISGTKEGLLALKSLLIQKMVEHWAIEKYGCKLFQHFHEFEMNMKYCDVIEKHIKEDHTYGIVDMGGGSVQVAYVDDKTLISQSFNGFGLKESMRKIKKHPLYYKCKLSNPNESDHCDTVFKDFFKLGPKIKKTANINQVDEIFLVSFFYDKFFTEESSYKKTIRSVKKEFNKKCTDLREENCLEVQFLISLLKYFDFDDDKEFFLVKKIMGINLNWSIAKAYELLQEEKASGQSLTENSD